MPRTSGRATVCKRPSSAAARSPKPLSATAKPPMSAKRRLKKKAPPAGAKKTPVPGVVDVQLATLEAQVPQGSQWVHEIKFDGYRLVCKIDRGKATLITRRHQDWTHK